MFVGSSDGEKKLNQLSDVKRRDWQNSAACGLGCKSITLTRYHQFNTQHCNPSNFSIIGFEVRVYHPDSKKNVKIWTRKKNRNQECHCWQFNKQLWFPNSQTNKVAFFSRFSIISKVGKVRCFCDISFKKLNLVSVTMETFWDEHRKHSPMTLLKVLTKLTRNHRKKKPTTCDIMLNCHK